jgi:hypothetical protein
MVTRQTLLNRENDMKRLRGLIPAEAPILVTADDRGFRVQHLDGDDLVRNARHEIAYTAIVAFLRGWRGRS